MEHTMKQQRSNVVHDTYRSVCIHEEEFLAGYY